MVKDILNYRNLYQTFVRTIFLGVLVSAPRLRGPGAVRFLSIPAVQWGAPRDQEPARGLQYESFFLPCQPPEMGVGLELKHDGVGGLI